MVAAFEHIRLGLAAVGMFGRLAVAVAVAAVAVDRSYCRTDYIRSTVDIAVVAAVGRRSYCLAAVGHIRLDLLGSLDLAAVILARYNCPYHRGTQKQLRGLV